ncbi:unnamed protein product [Mytilus edulis]|uniref:CCHC-type domain-containing protein n=1 Tax=Mytilus edulis TaxID=6550 RepID=A0A8S3SJI5_MYTED|nr:unnamed protein product [Mytilus edulis]
MLQRDLEKARENLRQELVIAGSQKTHLENRLQEEMDRNRDLVRRFEEQTITIKEMNRELVDLRSQLTVTHQALTNEVYRKPADDTGAPGVFRGSRSIPLPRTDSDDDLDDEFQRLPGSQYASKLASPKRRSHREYDEDDMMKDIEAEYDLPSSKQGRKLYPGFSEDDRSSTVSADVVAEAKYRLKSLEREAQNLDKAYRDFHYNLTNPSAGPDEQSRSHGRHVIGKEVVSESQNRVASPSASPIHRPMSSTPYQGRQSSQLNDSLRELTEQSTSRKEPPPRFDMSNMSDELNDRTGDERVERPRPITVADLEARPGSPSIVVVPGSESSAATSAMDIVSQAILPGNVQMVMVAAADEVVVVATDPKEEAVVLEEVAVEGHNITSANVMAFNIEVQEKGDDFTNAIKCGEMGHFARNCSGGGGGGDRNADVKCYRCNEYGHFARECDQ